MTDLRKKWTTEQIEYLRKLAAAGWPSSNIGDVLGVSRNSVIGMARRQGIPLGIVNKPKPPPRARNGRWLRHKPPAPWVPAAPKPAPVATPAPPRPCLLVDLAPNSCRWVLNDAWPHMFCGAPEADTTRGISYCRAHARIAYHRPRGRPENQPVSPKLYLIR